MDKRKLVISLSILAVMLLGIAVLMYVLFGGEGNAKGRRAGKQDVVISAMPSNAVMVARFGSLSTASEYVFSKKNDVAGGKRKSVSFEKSLADSVLDGAFPLLSKRSLGISFHYAKTIVPLYILDAGNAGNEEVDAEVARLCDMAVRAGYVHKDCDCSKILSVNEVLKKRRLVLVSPSVNLINSSLRHLNDDVSVYDAEGFDRAVALADGENRLFINMLDFENTARSVVGANYRKYVSALCGFSDWVSFNMDFSADAASLSGSSVSSANTDMVRIFSSLSASSTSVCEILPASTIWALSFPLDSREEFVKACDRYLDGRMDLQKAVEKRKALEKSTGRTPAEWLKSLRADEVAVAYFNSCDKVLSVNLVRTGRKQPFDSLSTFADEGCLSSLFGDLFKRDNEKYTVYRNGWLVSGDKEAVSEFASGRALSYTLAQKLNDAGLKAEIPTSASLVSYFSADQDFAAGSSFSGIWKASVEKVLGDCDIMPMFLTFSPMRKAMPEMKLNVYKADLHKTKAPLEENGEVSVDIPKGPFKVRNSGTGKTNYFVQNQNLSLSLRDENSKGLWTVPFQTPICGTASNVDYFANGKLQILFGYGSKIHLIDRLGRFVSPFPVELGKEILLGPAVYDFNGSRKYNIMVLHKDNTLRMYNLQGKVPEGWEDISPDETIMALPERVVAGSKSVWVVRTSRQTLIYPFMGGQVLSDFKGDAVLRADTEVKVGDDGVISAVSYDGKTRKIRF